MDPDNQSNIDSVVNSCFKTGVRIFDNTPKKTDSVTNKAEETFGIGSVDFYRTAVNLFQITVVYRGSENDYGHLGTSQCFLAYKSENTEEKILLYNDAIHNLEKSLMLEKTKSASNYYYLGVSQLGLADLLGSGNDREKKISLYQSSINNLKEAIQLEENLFIYLRLSEAQRELASLCSGEKKIGLYKEAINNLRELVKLRGDDWDYFYLGIAHSDLAEHLFEPLEIKEIKQQAIINLKKSYELKKDNYVMEKIQEIENSIF